MAVVALNGPEQRAFQRLVADLDREDPAWMAQMGALAPRRTRRVRLARVVVAVWCFVALVALPVSESGLAAAVAATVLALTGVACGIGAAVPYPLPLRVRLFRAWLRTRCWTARRQRRHRTILVRRSHRKTKPS